MSRRPDILDATARLSRFIAHKDWGAQRIAHLQLLLEPILNERGVTLDDVVTRVAEAGHLPSLMAFVDEAFFSLRAGPEGSSAIDAYLRRRGWQESPRAREYLQAMGKSEVSSRVVGDMVIAGLKELDHIAYVRYAIVYLGLDDLQAIRNEIDRLLEG